MKRVRRSSFATVLAATAIVILLTTAALVAGGADQPYARLQNESFELGPMTPPLESWLAMQDAPGNVSIVTSATETPGNHPTYATMGNITVSPLRGTRMLRLGVPRDKNNHELRGINSASQYFVTTSDRLSVGIRLFSWESRRDRGAFKIDVRLADGTSTGTVTAVTPATLPTGDILPTGSLPFTYVFDIGRLDYLATGWITVDIGGLPVGQAVTLSYTVDATHDASHDSWAYVDWCNWRPTAVDQAITTPEDTSKPFTLSASDNDQDPLTYTILSGPSNGSLSGAAPNLVYSPAADYSGADSFTYEIDDGHGGTASAQVSVSVTPVNDPPVARADTYTTDEDAPLAVASPGVLGNDGDVENDLLTASVIAQPNNGVVLLGLDGGFLYAPNKDFNGADTFTYETSDGHGGAATGQVTITVLPVNDAPVLDAIGNQTVDENSPLTIMPMATDVDGDPLTFSLSADDLPSGWTFDGTAFRWTPSYETSGTYRGVTFTVSDGKGGYDSETIDITVVNVNRPPVAVIDWLAGREGDINGLSSGSSYDPDAAGGDGVTSQRWTIVSPDGKQITSTAPGFPWIAPVEGDYIAKLTISDGEAVVETQTTIPVNDFPPLVNAVNAEVLEGSTATIMARTLDQGWRDSHEADWDVRGASGGGVADDHIASLSSGIATATVNAADIAPPGLITGVVSVSDVGRPSSIGSDSVSVRVVADDLSRFESGAGTTPDLANLDGLPRLSSDWSYVSWIQQPGDVDVYEIRRADGTPLTQATQCLVSLSNLPTDYDLVVLSTTPSNETTSSLQNAPLGDSPWGRAYWGRNDWGESYWGRNYWGRNDWSETWWGRNYWGRNDWSGTYWGRNYWGRNDLSEAYWGRNYWGRNDWAESYWGRNYWGRNGFLEGDLARDPIQHGTWSHFAAGWSLSGKPPLSAASSESFVRNPLNGYPFEEMSFTGLDASTITGTDGDAGELGLALEGTGLHVVGSSAHRGQQDEVVLTTTELATSRIFVAVVGHLESFSTKPYRLQIEESRPSDLFDIANSQIIAEPLLSSNPPQTVDDVSANPLTLFVTQRERMAALYTTAQADALYSKLEALSENPKVAGAILSVESGTWYDAWDAEPSDAQLANEVADRVRTAVRDFIAAHDTVKYVVLVGDDDVIPYRRVVDETAISNEFLYFSSSCLQLGSPLLASMYGGFNLTDDFYVDDVPTPWQGRALYLPDRAVSRLVETPKEMGAQIEAFLDPNGDGVAVPDEAGVLKSDTALVTGYDFFTDGALKVADILSSAHLDVTTMTTDAWTAAELKSKFADSPKDVSVPNAHFAHYAAMSASGYWRSETEGAVDTRELLKTQDLASASESAFAARLVMTIGCHAGLSVPDGDADAPDLVTGLDPALDFAQAVARQGGVFVGSTGFGLGDTDGIAGTEALVGYFASRATGGGGISVGDALAQAKKRYVMGLSEVTVYDEKSSIQFAMYGLPQWTLPATSGVQSIAADGSADAAASLNMGASPSSQPFTLHLIDEGLPTGTSTATYTLDQVLATNGEYFSAQGDAQFTPLRPAQPRIVLPLSDGLPVHGVIYRGAAYQEIGPGFDPVVSRPSTEWQSPGEPRVAIDGWWPNEPAVVNNDQASDGRIVQTLVVTPGQFRAESKVPRILGTERLYSDLTIEILRSASTTDFVAPTVSDIRLARTDATLTVSVKARDVSGIGRINVLTLGGTALGSADFTNVPEKGNDWYSVEIPDGANAAEYELVLQVADTWKNVTTVAHKGELISPLTISLTPRSPTYELGTPVAFDATIAHFPMLVQPVWYDVDFSDGTRARGTVTTFGPDGTATVSFSHTYSRAAAGPVVFSISDATGVTSGASARLVLRSDQTYVSPDGNDVTGDGSAENPFRTPHRALPVTATNGTIWVMPGEYSDNVVFDRQVNLLATDPGHPPVVDAANPTEPIISVVGVPEGLAIGGFTFDGRGTTNGILRLTDSSVTLSGCTLLAGTAPNGGAIAATGGTLAIEECDLRGNTATSSGGAIYANDCVLTITGSRITGNTAASGGGVFALDSTVTIERSTIADNTGGGVNSANRALRITNSVIAKNSGGGVSVSGAPATLVNDTVADNTATSGGGILSSGATSTVFNSILSGNTAAGQPQQADGCSVGYSYVGSNTDDSGVSFGLGVVRDGFGPPGFVDAAASDYRLQPTSLCIDLGAASWGALSAPLVDLVGATRPYGSGYDLGAYEHQSPQGPFDDIYVSTSGNDANVGTPARPKLTIQAGLDAVTVGGRVHVFSGTYAGNLSIARRVKLLSEDGPLKATIKGDGTGSVIRVTTPGVTVDGFVVTGGKSPGNGGGVDLGVSGVVTISNCSIAGNTASAYGGGVYALRGGLQLLNTSVTSNVAGLDGGGVYLFMNSGNAGSADPSLIRGGTYSGNSALNGGAIAGRLGPITIVSIRALSNKASDYGGAIDLLDSVPCTVSASVVQSNMAVTGGAAIALRGATSGACVNSVLDSNQVTGSMGQGGGFAMGTGSVALVNNVVSRNRAYWGSAGSWNGATVVAFNCIFWKNSSTKSQFSSPNGRTQPTPSYSYIDDASAKFNNNIGGAKTDPGFTNISSGDFSLLPTSMCINRGTGFFDGVNAPLVDIINTPRPVGGAWDIGAFEYNPH